MANKEKGQKHSFKVKKSIGATLLMLLLPLIILGTVGIIVFISYNARQVITEISLLDLKNEGEANAYKLGRNFQMITSKFGQYADTLETVNFEDREAMRKYIEPSASYAPVANSGIYISFDTDGGVIFANGLQVDMDARTRPWYAVGMENDTFVATDPYIDVTTETMCTTFVRKIDYYDGTKGVMGVDVYLADLQEEVNQLTPMKTGGSMVLTDDIIISYFDPELNGTLISESGSSYLEEVKAYVESGNEDPVIIKQNTTGVDYYVCEATIPGTPWVLISSVAVDDVMAEANAFMTFSLIAMILLVILIVAVILLTINKVITKPVNGLTESILKISDGDFTTSMPKDKGDEIGMISREMTRFVQIMNGAIGSIQSRAEQLQQDSESSKNASSQMSTQAGDQSVSMGQIQETMDDISNAVGELAENATNLAHAVSDLTEDGNQTNNTMLDLVEQAKVGQEDMTAVQQSMEKINDSMNEMNDVVVTVGDSAKEITDIVQMIDSIAEQTNLLSLNASIEAARAGEAGKGFAVVADEIGKLAQNSQDAAKEIGDIIRQITGLISDLAAKSQNNMDSINQSGEVVEKAGTSFNKIYDDLNETAEVMRQMIDKMGEVNDIASSVAAISEEQSASAEEITATIYTLTESASQIANESQGVEDVANSVSDSALAINDELSKFKIESDIQG